MNKKHFIKKCFKEKLQDGYKFLYKNKENTIMEYGLVKGLLSIYFVEDYRHEYLYLNVVWNSNILLVSTNESQCNSKVNCNNKVELEKYLKEVYNSLSGEERNSLSDEQFRGLIEEYKLFLQNNEYFENVSLGSVYKKMFSYGIKDFIE